MTPPGDARPDDSRKEETTWNVERAGRAEAQLGNSRIVLAVLAQIYEHEFKFII
jgi:hypothetical protein